jgi:hypothetical protein
MAKRTKSKRSTKAKGRGRKEKEGLDWLVAERWIAAGMLFIAATAALIFVPTLRAHGQSKLEIHEIRFAQAPTWAGQSLLQHLAETAVEAAGNNASPHHRETLTNVRVALDDTGWFAHVAQVQRDPDGGIVVRATFLAPATIVEDRYGEAIVDAKGRLLPAQCQLDQTAHIIRLIHPREARPNRARQAWSSEDVHAGLGVLSLIASKDWAVQIDAIDLSQWHRNQKLVLVTDRDATIVWGSAPGQETTLEASAERKLVRLDHLFRSSGRVDQHHSGEIDLTDASVVVRR